jgi:uncharacterized protein YbcI
MERGTRLKNIAVELKNGKCVAISKCIMADDTKIASLNNEVAEHEQELANEKEALLHRVKTLEEALETISKDIKFLKGE